MAKKSKGVKAGRRARGPRGVHGERGERGQRGERGAQGAPGISPQALTDLIDTVRQLRADSEIQLRRIADLQAQLDIALGEFHRMQTLREARGQKRN